MPATNNNQLMIYQSYKIAPTKTPKKLETTILGVREHEQLPKI